MISDNFVSEIEEIVKGFKGRLRIGIPIRRSPYIIPKVLKEFKKLYPNVEVILHEGNTEKLEQLLLKNIKKFLIYMLIMKKTQQLKY